MYTKRVVGGEGLTPTMNGAPFVLPPSAPMVLAENSKYWDRTSSDRVVYVWAMFALSGRFWPTAPPNGAGANTVCTM